MSPAHVNPPADAESPTAIRERGAIGAALLTVRAAAAQVVAFLGTLVLAHLLLPSAFGVVAFGTTVVTIGNFFADGGLGAALVRKPTDPTTDELRTLLALQLGVAGVLAVGIAVAGSQAGTAGGVTAVMAASLPLLALRRRTRSRSSARSNTARSPRSSSPSRSPTTGGRSRRCGWAGACGASPRQRSCARWRARC